MKLGEDIKTNRKRKKRDIQTVIVIAILLAIVTMSVSYSAFFSVQTTSTIQEIETGNLNVSIVVDTANSTLTTEEKLYPTSDDDIEDGYYTKLTLTNDGSVEAEYSVSISYDYDALNTALGGSYTESELREYLVSFDYLNVGIYDSTAGEWVNFASSGTVNYPAISSLTPSTDDTYTYPILRDTVDVGSNHVYLIYVWLDEDLPISEIGKYVYLKLNIKCAAGTETITEEVSV